VRVSSCRLLLSAALVPVAGWFGAMGCQNQLVFGGGGAGAGGGASDDVDDSGSSDDDNDNDNDDDNDVVVTDACALPPQPVTILPRTSNEEFRQFVTDLLGRPVSRETFAQWTPLAQVNGFDTMTESRIDPGALEAQLATVEQLAAELVATPAILEGCPTPTDPAPLCAEHATYDATAQFSGEQGRDCWSYRDANGGVLAYAAADARWFSPTDAGLFLWNNGLHPGTGVDVVLRWTAPRDGSAALSGSFFDADAGGGDGVVVVVRGPAGDLFTGVIANGGAPAPFTSSLPVRRGDVVDVVVQRGPSNAYDTTGHALSIAFTPTPPSSGRSWENCGQQVVERVAARAFRRPLRPEERDELRRVFDETAAAAVEAGEPGVFPEALSAALQATLLSPHVLYKPEFVPGGFDAAERAHQLASRLALYFRGSFPDDALRALADAGALDDAALRAQAERLLATSSERFVEHFGGQWLDFRIVGSTTPVSDDPLRVAMRNEAHAVFAAVLAEDLPAERLIAPGFTFVDDALAAHYGVAFDPSAPRNADGLARVTTDARGGLFTQGHFLTSTATGSEFKRVIHRGLYTLGRTLCQPMPMLDPATREEINASVDQIDPAAPLGDRMETHRTSGERCLGCHSQMDPLGLALERFDAQGLERDRYPDGSSVDNSFLFNGTSMRNPAELQAYVAESDAYRRCVAEKLLVWGLHRAVRPEERCVVDHLAGVDAAASSSPPSLRAAGIDAFLTALRLTETP
jgi:hypothetical protein